MKQTLLLINPQMTSRRSARFPLSLLTLAAALDSQARCRIVDGNVDPDYLQTVAQMLAMLPIDVIGMTVMGGPQLRSAIVCAKAIRGLAPAVPIVWGGYFPSLYKAAAMNADYVDFAVRGPGEATFAELLDALRTPAGRAALPQIQGLSWKRPTPSGAVEVVHNPDRRGGAVVVKVPQTTPTPALPYELLGDPRAYLARTFLGHRTAA